MNKLLIVEDEEEILELVSEVFGGTGKQEIYSAKDGEQALKLAQDENPDVILLDIQLPKLEDTRYAGRSRQIWP